MNQFHRCCLAMLLPLVLLQPAFAQAPDGPTPQQIEQAQRRAELRSALMKAQGPGTDAAPTHGLRQLSPEERTQLREQLRQQGDRR